MACGGAVEKLLLQRLLGDGQVRLVVEGGMDADLRCPAGKEQQRELLIDWRVVEAVSRASRQGNDFLCLITLIFQLPLHPYTMAHRG